MENLQEHFGSLVSSTVVSTTYEKSLWEEVSSYIDFPSDNLLNTAQALKSYAAMSKKLLLKQESYAVWFSVVQYSERAELARDLETVETGQSRTPHGPISTA